MILLMIVKNEAATIAKALRSAYLNGIRNAVILDTGSTDDTLHIAVDTVQHGVNVKLHIARWEGFGHARTHLMTLAHEHFPDEYGIMLDADDVITELCSPEPHKDAHKIVLRYGDIMYDRVAVFALRHRWVWRGVIHEFPVVDGMRVGDNVGAIVVGGGGARSRDPQKYLHDADLINTELMHEQDQMLRNRYCFYLAQSYRDAGHSGAAIYWYRETWLAQGWSEERYVACLNLARLMNDTEWYSRALMQNPHRAEAWRALGQHDMADRCKPDPANLFVEVEAYGPRP